MAFSGIRASYAMPGTETWHASREITAVLFAICKIHDEAVASEKLRASGAKSIPRTRMPGTFCTGIAVFAFDFAVFASDFAVYLGVHHWTGVAYTVTHTVSGTDAAYGTTRQVLTKHIVLDDIAGPEVAHGCTRALT
eukprot:2225197-Rhodomonas_salina.3